MLKVESFNGQSVIEEVYNTVSHGLGAIMAIVGTVLMIIYSSFHSSTIGIVSAVLYGASLILLYSVSSLYHGMVNYKAKRIFQICDHCSIFILIWGTYIPVALSMIGGKLGWGIFGFQGVCAIGGIILNAIDLKRWHKFSLFLYILMGWTIVFSAKPIFEAIDLGGLLLLLGGGVAYTVGCYFYIRNNRKFMHFVWHLFVIAGSILHYFFVLLYCI
ncbi:MAG TPA: hemolysin III family protein [Lachnospiraceae bacterium]|nr:hemolysin III family protein [Lachnospiraceae bacterium]